VGHNRETLAVLEPAGDLGFWLVKPVANIDGALRVTCRKSGFAGGLPGIQAQRDLLESAKWQPETNWLRCKSFRYPIP
jgi:hypothetical protein